jgi:hypothetical protein
MISHRAKNVRSMLSIAFVETYLLTYGIVEKLPLAS